MARQTLFPNMDSRLWLIQIRNVGVVNLSGKKRNILIKLRFSQTIIKRKPLMIILAIIHPPDQLIGKREIPITLSATLHPTHWLTKCSNTAHMEITITQTAQSFFFFQKKKKIFLLVKRATIRHKCKGK